MKWLARFIFHKLLGWQILGKFNPELKKSVIIVAPHTSNYDFFIGALARKIIGAEINYVAKKELFKPPYGWYFRWMGGAPLDRTPNQEKVDAMAKIIAEKDVFRLALSPEGTRQKVSRWKTGFYYIAIRANVPIIMVALDYGSKTVKVSPAFYPAGNFENDFKKIGDFYEGVQGKIPKNF